MAGIRHHQPSRGTTATMYEVQAVDKAGQPVGEAMELDLSDDEQEGAPTDGNDTYTRV